MQENNIDFDMLSKDDLAPIRYARIDSKIGEEVDCKNIVKGFQHAKGKYVVVTDEDFEKARPHLSKSIDVIQLGKKKTLMRFITKNPTTLLRQKAPKNRTSSC